MKSQKLKTFLTMVVCGVTLTCAQTIELEAVRDNGAVDVVLAQVAQGHVAENVKIKDVIEIIENIIHRITLGKEKLSIHIGRLNATRTLMRSAHATAQADYALNPGYYNTCFEVSNFADFNACLTGLVKNFELLCSKLANKKNHTALKLGGIFRDFPYLT